MLEAENARESSSGVWHGSQVLSFPMELPFARLEPEQIDASDLTFRVRSRYPESLRRSLQLNGIRSPLIVEPVQGRHRLVSGWGRWLCRQQDGKIPCFVLPGGLPLEQVWDIFLRDNESWNPVEIARILHALESVPGLSKDAVVAEKLPLLGVHPSRDLYHRYRTLFYLSTAAQRFIEEENLPLRRSGIFFKLPAEDVDCLLKIAGELHFTLNELAEVLDLLDEVSRRDSIRASSILLSIRGGPKGSDKEGFKRELRALRYPELLRYRVFLEHAERALLFSVPVHVEWDASLERPGIRLVVDLTERELVKVFLREFAGNQKVLEGFFEIV